MSRASGNNGRIPGISGDRRTGVTGDRNAYVFQSRKIFAAGMAQIREEDRQRRAQSQLHRLAHSVGLGGDYQSRRNAAGLCAANRRRLRIEDGKRSVLPARVLSPRFREPGCGNRRNIHTGSNANGVTGQLTTMRSKVIKPLLNLAAAAVIAQSAALPAWGAHLLSCGFTQALRTIQSAETLKAAAEKNRVSQRAFPPQNLI